MASGGYRKPSKPSSVSGPGAKSRRTDGGPAQVVRDLTGGAYGDAQQFHNLQTSAPLANSQASTGGAASRGPAGSMPQVTPFHAPTERPNEPVTAGNPLGPGPGPEAMGVAGGQQDSLERFRPYLPVLIQVANRPESSAAFRNFVRYLRGNL